MKNQDDIKAMTHKGYDNSNRVYYDNANEKSRCSKQSSIALFKQGHNALSRLLNQCKTAIL